MNQTPSQQLEPVTFDDVQLGDTLRFVTNENGFNGRGLYWRTGTVVKITAKTIRVHCGPTLKTAVLRRSAWYPRAVSRVVTP